MNMSKGEQKIISILRAENVSFVQEKSFENAIRVPNCRFDFYLPEKNILLEYNGEQHYEFITLFFKNRSEFLKAQERDRMKISAALAMKIPLYCIPYWDINNINTLEDILNSDYLACNKFHNDEAYRIHQNLR